MTRSFYPCDRDQQLLLPPSLNDWLAPDDLAYFVIDAVGTMNLGPFLRAFKDGSGQKAYSPRTLLPLLLFAYCQGVRSSRQIERLCRRDVGFRVVACNTFPDHTTIARFRDKFSAQLQDLFLEVLQLCRVAGLAKLGSIAIDGTKIKANAAMESNKTRDKLARQVELILTEAQKTDQDEDKQFGADKRGDELPEIMRSAASRRAALQAARRRQQRISKAYDKADEKVRNQINEYDNKLARREEDQAASARNTGSHEPKPPAEKDLNAFKANTTDPDSCLQKGRSGYLQGYNAQAAVNENQIIVATRMAKAGCDNNELPPMIEEIHKNVAKLGIIEPIGSITADAGYWGHKVLEQACQMLNPATALYVAAPKRYSFIKDAEQAAQPLPEGCSIIQRLEHQQRSPEGQQVYKIRGQTVEPVFGQIKSARGCDRFMQRGTEKVNAEWDLMCTTHNILKLWRHKKAS